MFVGMAGAQWKLCSSLFVFAAQQADKKGKVKVHTLTIKLPIVQSTENY